MKKLLTIALLSTFAVGLAGTVSAQTEQKRPPRNYINIAYALQDIKTEDGKMPGYKYGGAIEFGHTFFLNKVPFGGIGRLGIDLSYLDLQGVCYSQKTSDAFGYFDTYFANIGMQFGPSVTITPIDKLNLKAYVHYAPSVAAFSYKEFDKVSYGYAGHVTGGISVAYRFIALGFEYRWGSANFKTLDIENESLGDEKFNVKLPSTRFIVGFRF